MTDVNSSAKKKTAKSQPSREPVIYTHIECDRRKFWHSVVTVRHMGMIIWQLTATHAHVRQDTASLEAIREARRLLNG